MSLISIPPLFWARIRANAVCPEGREAIPPPIIPLLPEWGKSRWAAVGIVWVGGEQIMNLRNNQITVGELMDYAPARAVFQKRFPTVLRHPMAQAARTVTLEQVIAFAGGYIPRKTIQDTLEELRKA